MMKLITITLVAMLFVCTSAMATTISWTTNGSGARDADGTTPLEAGDLAQLWQDVGKDGIGGGDDVLLDSAGVHDGFLQTDGNFAADHTMTVSPADVFYIKVFNTPDTSGMWGFSATTVAPSTVPAVLAVVGPGMVTNIPEPSIMLVSGLALLLFRKRK